MRLGGDSSYHVSLIQYNVQELKAGRTSQPYNWLDCLGFSMSKLRAVSMCIVALETGSVKSLLGLVTFSNQSLQVLKVSFCYTFIP